MQKAQTSDNVWLTGEGTFYFLAKDWFLWNNRSTSGTLSWSRHLKWTVLIDINAETRQFLPTALFSCEVFLSVCFVVLFRIFCLFVLFLSAFFLSETFLLWFKFSLPTMPCVCVALRSTRVSPCHDPRHPWPKNRCLELIFARLV